MTFCLMKEDEQDQPRTIRPNKSKEMEVQTDSKFLEQMVQPPAPQTQTSNGASSVSKSDMILQNLKQIDLSKVVLSTLA